MQWPTSVEMGQIKLHVMRLLVGIAFNAALRSDTFCRGSPNLPPFSPPIFLIEK